MCSEFIFRENKSHQTFSTILNCVLLHHHSVIHLQNITSKFIASIKIMNESGIHNICTELIIASIKILIYLLAGVSMKTGEGSERER